MDGSKGRTDPTKSLVGFSVGQVAYAIPIGAVREIINPTGFTRLPHASPMVLGVADHRGEVVPIVDLRVRFGVPSSVDLRRTKWILIEVAGRTVGLVVDHVTEVFGTGGAELRPVPPLGGGEEQRGLLGVTTHLGRLVFVLDVGQVEALTAGIDLANNPALTGGGEG